MQYAQLSGLALSHVVSISAVVTGGTQTYDKELAGDVLGTSASRSPLPIRPGQQKVAVTVKVVWAMQ